MKFKLTAIYICILIALSSVGYISYHGLTNLMNALRLAIQPDERLKHVAKFENLLHSGENYMRLYSITRFNDYLLAHEQNMIGMQDQLDSLYIASEDDTEIIAGLDSIKLSLLMKIYCHEQLIRLKSTSVLPEMERRILTEADSMESEIQLQMDRFLKDSAVSLKTEEKKGLFSWLSRPRKKPEKAPVITDSLINIEKEKIRISGPIKNTIEEFSEKETALKRRVMEKELRYTVENSRLTGKIILSTDMINSYLDRVSRIKAADANRSFINTTRYIAWAGSISALLLLGMMLVIARDVQVIMKTKKELEAATLKAENLARIKEDFLATMSHEIRTPLNSMIGGLNQIRDEDFTEKGKNILSMIRKSSGHLRNVVNEILDYSKLEAGYLPFEDIRFNAWNIIQESAAMFRKEATDKNLELVAKPDEKIILYTISWDPVRLRQVLINLISNAIKFTKKGSVQIIAGLTVDSKLIIRVKDTGIGIRKDLQKKIFDRYIQVDDTRAGNYGGTGLGLSIVKKIVDFRGGEIHVESRVNEGTVFTVSIPVKIFREDQFTIQEGGLVLDLSNLSVLVADDDDYSQMMISKILRDHHASVYTAIDGWSAVRLIENTKIDLMIVDIHMPVMNGYEVVQANGGKIPSIAISAHLDERIIGQCLKAGFRKVIRKPLDEIRLLQAIRDLMPGEQQLPRLTGNILHPGSDEQNISIHGEPESNGIPVNNKLMSIYYKNISSALSEMKPMTIEQDFEKMKFIAHKLIPSTRHMGYNRLADILKKIEELILSQENKDDAMSLVADFIECARLIKKEISVKTENQIPK